MKNMLIKQLLLLSFVALGSPLFVQASSSTGPASSLSAAQGDATQGASQADGDSGSTQTSSQAPSLSAAQGDAASQAPSLSAGDDQNASPSPSAPEPTSTPSQAPSPADDQGDAIQGASQADGDSGSTQTPSPADDQNDKAWITNQKVGAGVGVTAVLSIVVVLGCKKWYDAKVAQLIENGTDVKKMSMMQIICA